MKAADLTRRILLEAQPVVITDEQPTLTKMTATINQLDAEVKTLWKSSVASSGGPECVIAGAIQRLRTRRAAVLSPAIGVHSLLARYPPTSFVIGSPRVIVAASNNERDSQTGWPDSRT